MQATPHKPKCQKKSDMKKSILPLLSFILFIQSCGDREAEINLDQPEKITIAGKNIFPEGIAYDKARNSLLLSSYGNGDIYSYNLSSDQLKVLISDALLVGPEALSIDRQKNILYVANGDAGVSLKSSQKTTNIHSGIAVYDLNTNKRIKYVGLASLSKDSLTIANGLCLDSKGDIYVTDSYRPVVYKVNHKTFEKEIFVEDERFSGHSFNLNGITYHPDGYLLALQMGSGKIYKIELTTKKITEVGSNASFVGADGILLINKKTALITYAFELNNGEMTNGAIKLVKTADHWASGEVIEETTEFCSNPTNSILAGNNIYVVNSSIGGYLFQGKNKDSFSLIKLKK